MSAKSMHPQPVAARWAERLTSVLKDSGHLYLLLNRLNGLSHHLQPLVEAVPEQWPLLDPYFGDAAERTPLLIKLTMAHLPLLDHAATSAAEVAADPSLPGGEVCAWLVADSGEQSLVTHLRRQLNLRLPVPGASVFFRYFDPRVMPQLARVLTPAQFAQLSGPVSVWIVPDRHGELLELPTPRSAAPAGRLLLEATQVPALERIETVNLAVRLLQMQSVAVRHADDARLDALLQEAARLGLEQPEDQAAFAALAYRWPPEAGPVATHEDLLRGIDLAREGLPLGDYIQQVPALNAHRP